jgi:hypothetical protein
MAETNGHAAELEAVPIAPATASAEEFDALVAGLFEPRLVELAPGRTVEIRPLMLEGADDLYGGLGGGSSLQRFMLARCVYLNGRPLGDELAGRLPVAWANRLVPLVMAANNMDMTPTEGAGGEGQSDPKA